MTLTPPGSIQEVDGSAMTKRSIRIILNGGKSFGSSLDAAIAAVRRRGHQVDVAVTDRSRSAEQLARQAVEDGIALVVAGGGDGTVNEVVNGLFAASPNPDVAMAVLPLGSANDFARGCGVPLKNPIDALTAAAAADPIAIDVARVNDRYFLNAVIGGFGAEVTFRASERLKRKIGGAAYGVAGFMSALRPGSYPMRLRTRDGEQEGPVTFVAIANGKWAGGVPIAPRASMCDGLLDLLLVPKISLAKLPAVFGDLISGRQDDLAFIRRAQPDWIEIEAPDALPMSPDGEKLCESQLRIEVLRRRLPFALPASSMAC